MYSTSNCYFCGDKLYPSPWDSGELRCFSQSHPIYRYYKLVDKFSINIENFQFDFWNYNIETVITETHLTGVTNKYSLPSHIEVTEDNYLQVVEKAKKLQIFK